MTHDEMIAVIQADKEGKPIQERYAGACSNMHWDKFGGEWNFQTFIY